MFTFRDAELDDLPTIVDIYNASIPSRLATADMEPITIAQRIAWFHAHTKETYPLWVATDDDNIIGWLSFSKFSERKGYSGTVEISIYIDPKFQGKGLGSLFLTKALHKAKELSFHSLMALIFSHNIPSIKLFEKFNFSQWGQLPDVVFMDNHYYSVSILGRKLTTPPSNYKTIPIN